MIIDHFSDPHFNHWMRWTDNQLKWESRTRAIVQRLIENGHGEVLCIAGDFSEWNCQSLWVLDEVSKHYERVYFTFGNHDLYLLTKTQHRKYRDSLGRLNELIEKASAIPNVVPLIKNVDSYKGVTFAGDAMWYLPKTEKDWAFYENIMSDSDDIKIRGCSMRDVPLKLHQDSLEWYQTLEHTLVDVFMSHIPPIHNPFSPFEPNGCYMTVVPFLVAKHWICGHEHIQREFERVGVKFHMNAIGYPRDYSYYPSRCNVIPEKNVDEYKSYEVKSFVI